MIGSAPIDAPEDHPQDNRLDHLRGHVGNNGDKLPKILRIGVMRETIRPEENSS